MTGSQAMYDTLVNDQTGARILDQSLTMQSLTHQDIFDTLTLSSFGWGGDPEQAARMRISKYSWYTFSGSYQHIQNYFDYDLFANPLNPPTAAQPFVPILNSPHGYYNRQNLYNFGSCPPADETNFVSPRLQPKPLRRARVQQRAPGHGCPYLTRTRTITLNGFRFGVDVRVTKKTTLSYTQMLQYYTGDTTYCSKPF